MALQRAQQAGSTARQFFVTQAGGCTDSACGAVLPARAGEFAPPSAPLISLRGTGQGQGRYAQPAPGPERTAIAPTAPRSQRREIRLTADEAAQIASLAAARGFSVSEYIRRAALRGRGFGGTRARRVLPRGAAHTLRELTAIAADLHRLVVLEQSDAAIPQVELRECLSRVRSAIGEAAP